MKTILITVVLAACAALGGAAMPTREETERAEPVVRKLMAPERAALESGKKTRSEVAAAAMKLADEADTDAAKLLLMKGAFVLYVKDGNLEKAVKTMNTLEKAIADMPPQCVTNMIETALLGLSKKEDGARLYRLLDAAKGNFQPPVDATSSSRRHKEGLSISDTKHQVAKDRTTVQSIIDGMIKVPGRDYWLSETELTQGQWEAVMGYNLSKHKGANLPADCVSRNDCDVFLEKISVAEKLQSCDFLLNKDFKKNAKYYLCLFSASWCGPCRREMPRIAKTYVDRLKADPDIELIHFSRDQDDEKALAWAKEHDVRFPVVKPKGGNPLNLKARGIPHLFIVKQDGALVEEGHPAKVFTEEKLRALK